MPLALELHGHEANGVVSLAMDHDQRLLAPRHFEDLQQLAVAENEVVIGHEHLEGGVAILDQRRQLLTEHDRRRIGDDQVKGGVDVAFAVGQLAVLLDTGTQRRAFLLQRKGKDHGVAAGRGRAGGGSEIVGHHHVGTGRLRDVDVTVDSARKRQQSRRIDLARGALDAVRRC